MQPTLEEVIVAQLSQIEDIGVVMLYGSFAKNTAKISSDVDIAIGGTHKFSLDTLLKTALDLEIVLHRQVDLVDLEQTHGVLLHEILVHGKLLLQRHAPLYVRYLMRHVTEQADFMPAYRRLLQERRKRFLHGSTTD